MGYAMAQMFETLRFFKDLRSHYGCVVDSVRKRNMIATDVSRGVKKTDALAIFTCRLPRNSGSLNLLESSGPVQASTGLYLYLSPLKSRGSESSSRLWLHYSPIELHITTSRTALIWVITQQIVVIPFRRLRTTYRTHLQGRRIQK